MPSLGRSFLIKASEAVDRRWRWDRVPVPLGLLTLIGIRDALRDRNLYDTYNGEPPPAPPLSQAEYATVRTVDGSYNDLSSPSMGMARTRFGRNVPPGDGQAEQPPRLFDPNPRTISNRAIGPDRFQARDHPEHPGGGMAAV